MVLSVHDVALLAHDPQAALAPFQAAGFGVTNGAQGTAWVASPNLFIAVHPTTTPLPPSAAERAPNDIGIAHVCLQTGNGEALWHTMAADGVAFTAPMTSLGGPIRYAYGRDAEHNLIEIEQVADAPPDPPVWIAHVALVCTDIDRSVDFYATLLGNPPHDRGRFANPRAFKAVTGLDDVDVSAAWVMADNLTIELWQYHHPVSSRGVRLATDESGYFHIAFEAADLTIERDRLAAADIASDRYAHWSGNGSLDALSLLDPDGNRIVIGQHTPPGDRLSLAGLSAPRLVALRNEAERHPPATPAP